MVVTEENAEELNIGFKMLIVQLNDLSLKDSSRRSFLRCIIKNIDNGSSVEQIKKMIETELKYLK